jgi:hypothetical protein
MGPAGSTKISWPNKNKVDSGLAYVSEAIT